MVSPSLSTLQHLSLHLFVYKSSDLLCGLVIELEAIAAQNIIKTIKIDMEVQDFVPGDECAALDKIFTGPLSGWTNLKLVSLKIKLEDSEYSDDEVVLVLEEIKEPVRQLPANQLRGLSMSKDIKFELEVTYLIDRRSQEWVVLVPH